MESAEISSSSSDNLCLNPNHDNNINNSRSGTNKKLASYCETMFNTLNYMLGTSLLIIPYVFSLVGWSAVILMAFFGAITLFTGLLLDYVMDSVNDTSYNYSDNKKIETYDELVAAIFGQDSMMSKVAGVIQSFELFLYVVGSTIIATETVENFWNISMTPMDQEVAVVADKPITNQELTIFVALVILPTMYIQNLKPLAYLSSFGLVSIVALYGMTLWEGYEHWRDDTGANDTKFIGNNWNTIGYSMGIAIGSYSGHAVFPDLKLRMKEPKKFQSIIVITYIVIIVVLCGGGIAGYYSYGNEIESLIYLSFCAHNTFANVAKGLLLLKLWSTISLTMSPVAKIVQKTMIKCLFGKRRDNNDDKDVIRKNGKNGKKDKRNYEKHVSLVVNSGSSNETIDENELNFESQATVGGGYDDEEEEEEEEKEDVLTERQGCLLAVCLRTIMYAIATVLAIYIPSIVFVGNIIGSICAVSMAVVYPILLYIVYVWKMRGKKNNRTRRSLRYVKHSIQSSKQREFVESDADDHEITKDVYDVGDEINIGENLQGGISAIQIITIMVACIFLVIVVICAVWNLFETIKKGP